MKGNSITFGFFSNFKDFQGRVGILHSFINSLFNSLTVLLLLRLKIPFVK